MGISEHARSKKMAPFVPDLQTLCLDAVVNILSSRDAPPFGFGACAGIPEFFLGQVLNRLSHT